MCLDLPVRVGVGFAPANASAHNQSLRSEVYGMWGSSSPVVKRMNEQTEREVNTNGQNVILRVVPQGDIIRETDVTAAENAVRAEILLRFFA